MIKRGYNMRAAILQPMAHKERLAVAEKIVCEVLSEHATPGRVLDDEIVKTVTELTVAAIEASVRGKS